MEAIRNIRANKDLSIWLTMGRIFTGFVWLYAGIEKLATANFSVAGAAAYFASKNPNAWYADFLRNTVIPNAGLFTQLVMYGEILAGLALIFGLLTNVAALFGAFMSFNFWLAAAWTGPSTEILNVQMALVQLMFIAAYGTKYFSIDQFIANHWKVSALHWFLLSRPVKYTP